MASDYWRLFLPSDLEWDPWVLLASTIDLLFAISSSIVNWSAEAVDGLITAFMGRDCDVLTKQNPSNWFLL